MGIREELTSFLSTLEIEWPEQIDDDTPLVSSGRFDSTALFNLTLWIEDQVGAPIDPASANISQAWDSPRLIIEFIEARRAGRRSLLGRAPLPRSRRRSDGLTIVRYSPEHADAVARLQQIWSPHAELNRRYLAWKYENGPYSGEPLIYLAFDQSELVGMRGFYPSRWQVGERPQFVEVLVADDLIVRETHSNRGVVTSIMQAAFDDLLQGGVEYVFNLTGSRVTVLGSLAMGWQRVGHLNPLGRTTISHAMTTALRDRAAGLPWLWRHQFSPRLRTARERHPLAGLEPGDRFESRHGGVITEVASEPRVKEMTALIARLPYDGRIRHVRDAEFLAWRYRNPLNDYRFFYAGSDTLRGYLVVKQSPFTFTSNARVQIVDYEAEDDRHLDALLEAAIAMGSFPELVMWGATRSSSVLDTLARHGFKPVDRHLAAHGCPCVLVRACDPLVPPDRWQLHGTPLLDLSRWDMRMIYTMAG